MAVMIPQEAFHRYGRFMRATSSRLSDHSFRASATPASDGSSENLASAGKRISRYDGFDFHRRSGNVLMSWSS